MKLKLRSEHIEFKILEMPCCGHLLSWVCSRFPTYCPECGKKVYPEVKDCVLQSDDEAVVEFHAPKAMPFRAEEPVVGKNG